MCLYSVPADITEDVTDLLENETNPVTFICVATGEPVPTISWYFNNILLDVSDHNISSTVNGIVVESLLTIFNAQSSDVGTYTCHAENFIGTDRSSGILTVNGKLLYINNKWLHRLVEAVIVVSMCTILEKCIKLP